MLSPAEIDAALADLDKRQSVHEAVCAERYEKIVASLEEVKTTVAQHGGSVATIATQLTERSSSGRTVREVVAYLIAGASIVAALYSGGLVHVAK